MWLLIILEMFCCLLLIWHIFNHVKKVSIDSYLVFVRTEHLILSNAF